MSDEWSKAAVVRVSGGGGEVATSVASLAALVCAPQHPDESVSRRRALEEAILLQLEALRAHRARAARR